MIHTVIVPGAGGSDFDHWQSWLQRQLMSSSRVQQQDWQLPILEQWVNQCVKTLQKAPDQVQIIAHSFGCLTSVATLARHPMLAKKVKKMLLVAPANPSRFGERGFARDSVTDYASYFHQLKLNVPTEMIISENDPWLAFADAQRLAQAWHVNAHNLGQVGHINVASGFGPFPEIYDYMITEQHQRFINHSDDGKLFFKFAI
ncbi:hypothetical protein EC844_107112 [Acinetobacter calcoaceticus]|uniref:Alpha/beta hydrolase n=1 Tax=Acinetobacter calcoaceticus TaxID=471 RepID=A0A4R1XTP4_ACICA|nr:hypothetical protein EC844_107112 [Acinetobacter calcoaceticus]